MGDGTAGQTEQAVAGASDVHPASLTRQAEVGETEPAENAQGLTGSVINPGIKAVLAERARTRTDEVVQHGIGLRSREGLPGYSRPPEKSCRSESGCRRKRCGRHQCWDRRSRIVDLTAASDACCQILAEVAEPRSGAGSVRRRIAGLRNPGVGTVKVHSRHWSDECPDSRRRRRACL